MTTRITEMLLSLFAIGRPQLFTRTKLNTEFVNNIIKRAIVCWRCPVEFPFFLCKYTVYCSRSEDERFLFYVFGKLSK